MSDSRTLPDIPNKPGKTNWVERAGGLPKLIERIAKHLRSERGYDTSRAIATAASQVQKICATGRTFGGKTEVNAKYRAEACAAAAEWKRKAKGAKRVREAAALTRDADELTDEDVEALGTAAAERLAMLERLGTATTGPGAEFDRFLVEAAGGPRVVEALKGAPPPGRKRKKKGDPPRDGDFEGKHPRDRRGNWITKGASGEEVKTVQRAVGAKEDGDFGDATRRAVMAYQRKHGLKVDGIVGRQTASAIRGNTNAKKLAVGKLAETDRQFLRGKRFGKKGSKTTRLVEAVAPEGLLERVRGLELGELARLPDGGAVKHHSTEDGRSVWTAGRPTSYGEGISWAEQRRTAEDAVRDALTRSASSTDPAALGGGTRYGYFDAVLVNGRAARFHGVSEHGAPLVRFDDARPGSDPVPTSWASLSLAPRPRDAD